MGDGTKINSLHAYVDAFVNAIKNTQGVCIEDIHLEWTKTHEIGKPPKFVLTDIKIISRSVVNEKAT